MVVFIFIYLFILEWLFLKTNFIMRRLVSSLDLTYHLQETSDNPILQPFPSHYL